MSGQRLAGKWWVPLGLVIGLLLWAGICQAAPSSGAVAEIIGINGQVEARVRAARAFSPAIPLQINKSAP
ncbi:MAG: hypothetical protein FJ135_15615 [Deltaproteobacteria bacterium]|nr:hypothetical protein [Deltaproteobacteria bacterium]